MEMFRQESVRREDHFACANRPIRCVETVLTTVALPVEDFARIVDVGAPSDRGR